MFLGRVSENETIALLQVHPDIDFRPVFLFFLGPTATPGCKRTSGERKQKGGGKNFNMDTTVWRQWKWDYWFRTTLVCCFSFTAHQGWVIFGVRCTHLRLYLERRAHQQHTYSPIPLQLSPDVSLFGRTSTHHRGIASYDQRNTGTFKGSGHRCNRKHPLDGV